MGIETFSMSGSRSFRSSVVLVWLHIIRFSFSKKANEEQSLILVSQLKGKKGY